MVQGVSGGDQYGMGIEGGLNSNSEDEGYDDSDSLSHSISRQQPQPPFLQPSTERHSTISQDASSNKLKNSKKKEQKKRKKEEKKRAKLAGELEKVKEEKRKAVDEVVSTTDEGSEKKKRKGNRKSEKGKGSNAWEIAKEKSWEIAWFSFPIVLVSISIRRLVDLPGVPEREKERDIEIWGLRTISLSPKIDILVSFFPPFHLITQITQTSLIHASNSKQ